MIAKMLKTAKMHCKMKTPPIEN